MADQNESWILHHILDRYIGSRETVETIRKLTLAAEKMLNCGWIKRIYTGSAAEGIEMEGSDRDTMLVISDGIVICPDQDTRMPPNNTDKTVFMMREADSRPGYVTLELVKLGQTPNVVFHHCIIPVRDTHVMSSEMFAQHFKDIAASLSPMGTHDRVVTLKADHTFYRRDCDYMSSLQCKCWPREANEWVRRPRLYEWPDEGLRDKVVKHGCYLVPVGDKTSVDPFLQWRISFTTAERTLIYSLTHTQFLIYGLLKYFLKQMADRLKRIMGEDDILTSYIIKTVIFHAVESTPVSLWQEKNTFFCFMLCFKILIAWVKAGHCPNYFISSNNMFHGKICGENKKKILRFLVELHDMKWECLSVGTFIQPSIGTQLDRVRNGYWEYVLIPPKQSESKRDMMIFQYMSLFIPTSDSLSMLTALLPNSKSDIDECIAYFQTVLVLSCIGEDSFEKHVAAKGNKEKYKYLRKCKNLMSTSPGLLKLATFYYQTGNYMKTLEMCGHMISSFKIYCGGGAIFKDKDRYEDLYCERGYTLIHKFEEACASFIRFDPSGLEFCPSHLHNQLTKHLATTTVGIPPLPYAVFLTFLCYHELGDTRRRNTSLKHLRAVKYDEEQGCGKHWIVNNLLGICYETVGDTHRALREYKDSLGGHRLNQYLNPAIEIIEQLQHSPKRQTDEY